MTSSSHRQARAVSAHGDACRVASFSDPWRWPWTWAGHIFAGKRRRLPRTARRWRRCARPCTLRRAALHAAQAACGVRRRPLTVRLLLRRTASNSFNNACMMAAANGLSGETVSLTANTTSTRAHGIGADGSILGNGARISHGHVMVRRPDRSQLADRQCPGYGGGYQRIGRRRMHLCPGSERAERFSGR